MDADEQRMLHAMEQWAFYRKGLHRTRRYMLPIPFTTTIPFRKEHTHRGANERRHMKLDIERGHDGRSLVLLNSNVIADCVR